MSLQPSDTVPVSSQGTGDIFRAIPELSTEYIECLLEVSG